MTRFLLPVVAIALFMSFFRLGSVTLFDVDEAVFSEAAKEMVESGDWVTPTYNGENRYDKPIFFYWLMAVSYKIFGINEFSARFPSAISGLILCLAVFLFVRHFHDERKAFYTVISLTLSVYFLVYSHAAVTDMALTLFIMLSLFSFYLSVDAYNPPSPPHPPLTKGGQGGVKGGLGGFSRDENSHGVQAARNRSSAFLYGFYLFSALAFLTKGLIGIVFPFGIAFVYLLTTEGFTGIKRAFHVKGAALFLIVAAPWFIAQFFINGQEFIQQFFIKHHFMRYTGVISGHRGPIYYYIPVLIIGLLPWIAFLPGGIRSVFRKKNSELKTQNSELPLFAFIWFVFIFVFFSFSTTKLPNYILPAIPAVSMLISSGMTEQNSWRRYAHVGMAIIIASIGIAFLISGKYLLQFGFHDIDWTIAVALIMCAMAILIFYAAFSKKTFYGVLSALMIAFLSVLSIKALPLANRYLQGTLYQYSLFAKDRLRSDEKIITYGINNPSIVFYSGHKIVRVGNKNELLPLIKQEKRLLIISKAKEIEVLKDLGFNLLEEDKMYAILEKQ